ncbi:hypothetical protein GF415_01190 [Candidatus Micrarchaeota archaeon]|nr:hypothetical protein [Candidatus Micrarchaeota archaeon]
MGKSWIVSAVFCFFLLLFCIYNLVRIEELKKENSALRAELGAAEARLGEAEGALEAQDARISSTKDQLEYADSQLEKEMEEGLSGLGAELNATKERIGEVEEEFGQFQEEYISLQEEYEQKTEEYESLRGEMEDFEAELEEKMYWYTENADFGGETKGFISRIETKCVEGDTLNMPCVALMLEERDFSYKSEGEDYIKSLDEFEADEGGDCEDWSMFVKAIINELEREEGVDELVLVDFSKSGYMEVYEDEGVTYYYSNEEVYADVEDVEVACFPVTSGYGHCALVSGGKLFEPQEGSYIGEVYWEEGDYLVEGWGFVEVYIDEEDIHIDSGDKWISYSYFIERIGELLEGKEE